MTEVKLAHLRPVIIRALVVCLVLAAAPWLGGGDEPLARLIAAGAVLTGALLLWRQPQVRQLGWGPLVLAYGLLVGFGALSLGWSVNTFSTMIWLSQWLVAGVAFVLAFALAGEAKGRRWLVRAYLGSVALFCLVALWMYVTGQYERLTGTFYLANPAAAYMMPAVLLLLARLKHRTGRLAWWWAGALGGLLACFWLADSRGAILVLGLTSIIYILWRRNTRGFWIKLLFSLVLAGVMSFGLVSLNKFVVQSEGKPAPGARFNEAVSGQSQSAVDRWEFLRSAGAMWLDRPWGGLGAGTYGDAHPKYQTTITSASAHAHNLYAQTLAELGVIGGGLLLWLVVWVFAGIVRGVVVNGFSDSGALAMGVVALALHFGLDIGADVPALLVLAAIGAGMIYQPWHRRYRRPGWAPTLLALVALVPVVGLYQSQTWANRAVVDQTDEEYSLAAQKYAEAQGAFVYNPDHLTGEGINLYTLAAMGSDSWEADLKLALERAKRAQQLDPLDGQHYQLEGRVLSLRGDVRAAEGAYRRALELDRFNHPDYTVGLALVLLRQGNRQGARAVSQAMLDQYRPEIIARRHNDVTLRPALANLAAIMGNLALQDGRIDQASVWAKRAVELDPQGLRGRALQRQVERPTAQP